MEADNFGVSSLVGAAAGGVAGIILSIVAYVAVEQPLRRRGTGRGHRLAIIAAGFFLVTGAAGFEARQVPPADPAHRFDTVAFRGLPYSAGNVADGNPADNASRYRDVVFPALPPRPVDPWRTGGITHLYGGPVPQVVVLGSSHALMYSRLIDDICRELKLSVAFLGVDQTPVFKAFANGIFRTAQEAQEFDAARKTWLQKWRPQAVFLIDRWDNHMGPKEDFDGELRSFLSEISPLTGRILFVAQVPVAITGELVNLREFVSWRSHWGNDWPRIQPDQNDGLRQKANAVAEAAMLQFPKVMVLRPDRLFYESDGSIRWASGRTFYYADDDHLSDAGTEVVRSLFLSALRDARPTAEKPHPN